MYETSNRAAGQEGMNRRTFLVRAGGGALLLVGSASLAGCSGGGAGGSAGGGAIGLDSPGSGNPPAPTTRPVTAASPLTVYRDYVADSDLFVYTDASLDAGLVLFPQPVFRDIFFRDGGGNTFESYGVLGTPRGYGYLMTKQIHIIPAGDKSRAAWVTFRDNGRVREVVPDQSDYWWSFDWTSPGEARVLIVKGEQVAHAFKVKADGAAYQVSRAAPTRAALARPVVPAPHGAYGLRTRASAPCDGDHEDDVRSAFSDFRRRATQIADEARQAAPFFKGMATGVFGGAALAAALGVSAAVATPMMVAGGALGLGMAIYTETVPKVMDATDDPCTVGVTRRYPPGGGSDPGPGAGSGE